MLGEVNDAEAPAGHITALSPQVEKAIRELPEVLRERQIPLYRWTFALARRLMKYPKLSDEGRGGAAALFHEQIKNLNADPDGRLHEEGVAADLCRFALMPPRQAERESPLDSAVQESTLMPLRFKRATGPLYNRIGSIAYHLDNTAWASLPEKEQRLTDHAPIFLPQKQLAQRLGVHQSTVSSIVALLVLHGVLQVKDAHWSYTKRQAKEYLFVADGAKGDFTCEAENA